MKSNDVPVTDAELDAFYGKEVTVHIRDQEEANHVCRALREIKGGISLESLHIILPVLASKVQQGGGVGHTDVEEVVEYFDELYDEVEYFLKERQK